MCRISVRKWTAGRHTVSACPEQSCFFLHLSVWSCWFWVWFKSTHNDGSFQKAEITNPSNFLAHASAIAEVGKNIGGNAAELVLIRRRASHVKSLVSQFLIKISWFFDIDTSAPPLLFALYVLEPYSSLVKQCGRPRDLGSCVLCVCSSHIWVCYVLSAVEGRKRMGAVVFVLRNLKNWYWWSLSHSCAHMFLSCSWRRI